jgi:hypothetical protein
MKQYIEHILKKELELFVSLVVDKYGIKGNFTKSDLLNKFIINTDTKTIITNDQFKKSGSRGRPRKIH